MKKYSTILLSIAASLFLSAGLLAQEKIEVSVKVTKDGKVVKDTTYQFKDASEAKHAMKMMEVLSGDDEHMEHITYNYTSAHSGSGKAKTMVFISEDGEKTEIKEIHADSLVWIEEKHGDGDHVKVMKYKIKEGEEPQGKHVVVMKSDDGKTFDILVDEDFEEGDVVKKKEVKVVVSADDDATWHVDGDEIIYDKDENVYIIKGDDEVKMKVMKIMEEEGEGEDVKVIVIKKDEKDHDMDHDMDVDVKVVKKKEKK
jgi:hypothetical protein